MQMQERGYGHSDKRACEECVGKRLFFDDGSDDEECDFCDNVGATIAIDDVCGEIAKIVKSTYRPVDGYPPDMKTGADYGPTKWDTYDLFHEVLAPELGLSDKVLDEVIRIFDDPGYWGEINPSA